MSEFWKIAFAMSAWGEFAFIISTYAHEHHIITHDEYSSVVLAVLLSVVISPVLLSLVISYYDKKAKVTISEIKTDISNPGVSGDQQVYYCVDIKTGAAWGQQKSILDALYRLKLEIVDFRSWHAATVDDKHPTAVFFETYLRDTKLTLPPMQFVDLEAFEKEKISLRVRDIHETLNVAVHCEHPSISISR